jgi:hypothetical protein
MEEKVFLFEKLRINFVASESTPIYPALLEFSYKTYFLPRGNSNTNSVKGRMDLKHGMTSQMF